MSNFQQQQKDKYLIKLSEYETIKEIDGDHKTHNNDVFIIKNKKNNKIYVAKSCSPILESNNLEYFIRELKILIYIQHPTIIKLKGFSYTDIKNQNNITIITKYVENGTLADFISSKDLDDTNRQIILTGIAFGMMLLHNYYVIYRDLKPENVLLDSNYYPIIADFDRSKIFDPHYPANNTLKTIGTSHYIAPEILVGNNYNIKIDIYSFAILMYEVVTGKRAYLELNERQRLAFYHLVTTMNLRPEIVSIKNLDFTKMITKCWDADAEKRPSFYEIFKKLSLLSKEEIEKYENQFPFLKNDKSNVIEDVYKYSFDKVDKVKLHSYVEMLFNKLGPQKVTEIDTKISKNICENILSLFETNAITEKDKEGNNKEFLTNLFVFLPKEKDLQPILSDIKIGSFKMLTECFIFEAFNENLEKILENDDLFTNEGSLKIVSYYTFCSWISIILKILKKQEIDFSILLAVLNKIINIESIYHDIALTCFTDVLYLAIEKNAVINFDAVMKEVSEFYVKRSIEEFQKKNLKKFFYPILNKYIKENKEELDHESITVINIVSNIIDYNPVIMDNQTAYIVFYLTNSYINQFEKNCVNLFLKMSKYIDKKYLNTYLGVAQKCFQEIPFEEAIDLFSSIIKALNEFVIFKKSISIEFNSIIPKFYQIAMSLDDKLLDNKQVLDIFIPLIDFWYSVYQVKNSISISIIESLICHFFNRVEKIEIIEQLVQILAGNKQQNLNPEFKIINSFVLCLLVKFFLMTNQICNVLGFISSLCSFSEHNCIKCHECELDLLIIDILSRWRKNIIGFKPIQPNKNYYLFTDFNSDENDIFIDQKNEGIEISEYLIDLLLHLFSQIALKSSSISTIHRYFQLLCPFYYNNSLCLSLIHIKIIGSLNEILNKSKFLPDASLPMPSSPISVLSIPSKLFKDGFSIVFWIYKSSLCEKSTINILKLNEKKQKIQLPISQHKNLYSLNLQINEDTINLNMKSGNSIINDKILDEIPLNQWSMFTFTILNEKSNHSNVSFYLNQDKIYTKEIEILFSPTYPVDCIINNDSETIIQSQNYLLGNFIFSKPLLNDEIFFLYSNGQKSNSFKSCSNKFFLAFTPYNLNGELSCTVLTQANEINPSFPHLKYQKELSFSDLLIENNKNLEIIIPIFNQSDLPLKDGSSGEFINIVSVLILKNLLHLGNEVQLLIFKSNFLYAIANSLQQINAKYITNTLYFQYFYLLDSISYENLRLQLIDVILMNYDLWKRADFDKQQIIFKNWIDTLYINNANIINSIRTFQWFLFNIQNCNYSEIRKCLFSISFEIFKNKPSSELISLVISLIILQSQSVLQQAPLEVNKEMIDFLNLIFSEEKLIESIQFDFSEFFNLIFTIFVDKKIDDEFVYKIISLLVSIHIVNDVNIQIPLRNIAIILNINEEFFFTKEFFTKLISLLNLKNAIEILPILCINAINKGEEYFSILEKQVKNDLDYYIDEESTIYSALLIFKFFNNKNFYHKSIKFNLSIFKNHLLELINVIYTLGILGFCSDNFDQIRHDVFCGLFSFLKEKNFHPQEIITLISSKIKDFIFLRLNINKTQPLNSLFNINYDDEIYPKNELESIFISFKNFGIENSNDIKILSSLNLLFDKLKIYSDKKKLTINNQVKNYDYEINLRLKENNWLDLDLVEILFDFYITNEVYQLNEFMSILASCTSNYNPDYISYIMNGLSKSLNLTIEQFDIKNSKKKFKFKIFINSIKTILSSFKSFNLQRMNKLNDIYQIYYRDFKNGEKQFENIEQITYNNIMNSLTSNRSGWLKLKTKYNKSIYKRNNLFCCYYCCPFNVYKKASKFIKKMKIIKPNKNKLIKCELTGIKSNKEAFIKIEQKSINLFYNCTKKVIPFTDIYLLKHFIYNQKLFKLQILDKFGENFNLIFCNSGFSNLIDLISQNSVSFNYNNMKLLKDMTTNWSNGKITNFEYLMKLNFFSGRSFNDAKCYPILPWILSRYDTLTLDLNSPSSFRDLSKPICTNNENIKPIEFYVYFWLFRIEPFMTKYNENKENYSSIFTSIDESYKEATTELVPEFFFLPEFLKSKKFGDVNLPSWSNQSAIEFIYLHRKALESKFVSEHLNEWIDLIWGVKMNKNEESLFKIFFKEHPKRTRFIHKSSIPFFNKKVDTINSSTIKFKEISTFISADVSLQLDKSLLFFSMVDFYGNIYLYSIGFNLFESKFISVKNQKIIVKNERKSDKNLFYHPIFIGSQHFCFIENDRKTVKFVNSESGLIEKTIETNSEIISIGTHQNGWIGISTDDSSMLIYDINNIQSLKQSSVPSLLSFFQSSNNDNDFHSQKFFSYPGKIECISINPIFNLFVCGTNDNCLLFCQLNLDKMKINRVVKTDEKPLKIIITDNFGFVVVLLKKFVNGEQINELVLYSVNGEKIRSLSTKVESFTKASSSDKFDYLIVADENNQIFVSETFYLKLNEPIFVCKSRIRKLSYIEDESLIIAFCEDGTASVIYYPIG